jgi:hypothetical protein
MIRPRLTTLMAAGLFLGSIASVCAQQPEAGESRLTLLDAGSGPRTELRYRLEQGATERMAMDITISVTLSMAGQQIPAQSLPTVRMIMDGQTTDVYADGTSRLEFTASSAEILNPEAADPLTSGAINSALEGVQGVAGWTRIDARGRPLEGGMDFANVDPNLSQVTDNFSQQIQQLSPPFPEEPVGVGARWQFVTSVTSGPFAVEQTAEYTLVSHDDDGCELMVTLTQSAPAQAIEIPGLPPGTQANLQSMESNGSGTMRINLRRLAPTSQMNIAADVAMTVSLQGTTIPLAMNLTNDFAVMPIAD